MPGCVSAIPAAHRRRARSTVAASGHLRTDEVDDLTGIADGLVALEHAIVLERGALGVAVRVSGRDVEGIQYAALVHQDRGRPDGIRQLDEELCDDMPPGVLPQVKMQGFDGLLPGLLGGKACPLVTPGLSRIRGLLDVPQRLVEPISRTVRHGPHSVGAYYTCRPRRAVRHGRGPIASVRQGAPPVGSRPQPAISAPAHRRGRFTRGSRAITPACYSRRR